MPRYRVIVEFRIHRAVLVRNAADEEEASELALEEVQNSGEAIGAEDFDIVDIFEED